MSQTHPTLPAKAYAVELHGDAGGPMDREWLLTNGLGGYAMGTVSGCNTRRYHGLLIATQHPPVERFVTVNCIGESLEIAGHWVDLFTHEFTAEGRTLFHPQGWKHLVHFEKACGTCCWTFEYGPIRLVRTLRLVREKNVAVLNYHLQAKRGETLTADRVKMRLIPFLSMRDFHALQPDLETERFDLVRSGTALTVKCDNAPPVHLAVDRGCFIKQSDVWKNFYYRIEAQRQQDCIESLYVPGFFEYTFTGLDTAGKTTSALELRIGTDDLHHGTPATTQATEKHCHQLRHMMAHVTAEVENRRARDDLAHLTLAADDFVTARTVGDQTCKTILAGYPWFADWGRDTMISLPGLLLCTGRYDDARQTLLTFARHMRNGLVPNRFDDYGGQPHYNTVDASLWFVHAALEYLATTGDQETWNDSLAFACRTVINAYIDGTDFDIRMDGDGLVMAGDEATQLTWMDAKRDGIAFTPRHGKAVEINALWHSILARCSDMIEGSDKARYTQLVQRIKRSFSKLFWSDQAGYLVDHVNDEGPDATLRPNQVFAVSLPHSPLPVTKQKKVLVVIKERLLTPMGLRTLPVDDWRYHGRCDGSMFERDRAYHQGTVWPWLIGPYVEGLLRANRFTKKSIAEARSVIKPLVEELTNRGMGQLHEIFDGDEPHAPRGCIAQAWSVAELLRVKVVIERGGQ